MVANITDEGSCSCCLFQVKMCDKSSDELKMLGSKLYQQLLLVVLWFHIWCRIHANFFSCCIYSDLCANTSLAKRYWVHIKTMQFAFNALFVSKWASNLFIIALWRQTMYATNCCTHQISCYWMFNDVAQQTTRKFAINERAKNRAETWIGRHTWTTTSTAKLSLHVNKE